MIDRKKLWSVLGYTPHLGQQQMHDLLDDSSVRRLVTLYGRRAGKTHGARFEAIYQSLQPPDDFGPPLVYIVSDTYAHSKKLFDAVALEFSRKLQPLLKRVYVADLKIKLTTGAEIHAKSADNPSSLAGDGVSFAVLEEAGFIANYATEVLLPALSERRGKALAVGTPDHGNWYRDWFYLGQARADGYRSLQLPTSINPHFPRAELEWIQANTPERLWRKYYRAEFIDDEGALFKRDLLEQRCVLLPSRPNPRATYYAGVDLARSVDFTVVCILERLEDGMVRQVALERWQGMSWDLTLTRIVGILRHWDARAVVDATGVGDPVFEAMARITRDVEPFVFTSKSKPPLLESLALALEQGKLDLLRDEIQRAEFAALQAKQTSTGVRYAAPDGMHDDTVMAAALAWRAAYGSRAVGNNPWASN